MKSRKKRAVRMMAIRSEIASLLLKKKRILLLCHVTPDGDCIGSLLALGRALKRLDKEVIMACEDDIPSFLKFLLQEDELIKTEDVTQSFDIAIAIDSADSNRLGDKGLELFKTQDLTINIDHHSSNPNYGAINYVDPKRSATGEIIMDLILDLGLKLDEKLSEPLYTALFTDTGGFRFSNTTAQTLEKAAKLVKAGANPAFISSEIHEHKSPGYFKLLALAFNRITLVEKICYTWISFKEVEDLGLDFGAAEELSTYMKMMANIEIAIVFKEKEKNLVKVSLRSQSSYNVATLAEKFGGGGHPKAAGCVIEAPLNTAINQVLAKAKEVS